MQARFPRLLVLLERLHALHFRVRERYLLAEVLDLHIELRLLRFMAFDLDLEGDVLLVECLDHFDALAVRRFNDVCLL